MKSLRIFSSSLLAIAATLCLRPMAQAQSVDPRLKWFVLETPHFHIVYDSKHYWLAQRYAGFAEQAYQGLQPLFKEAPEKTTVVLNDSTDEANGFATQLPYPLIMAYPVLPLVSESVSDYGNWGLELLTHEYTHILNMEPAHGVMKPLSYVFGSIIKPNEALPRWYLEGLAVEMETRYSHFGRLRSANYLSSARAMVEEGTLRKEDISRINEIDIPDWPGGLRPYLIGSLMWTEILEDKGDSAVYDLNQRFSRRVPGFLNQPIIDVLGLNWTELLDRTYEDIEKMVGAQIKAISSAPRPKEQRMQQEGYFSSSPEVSPDGTKLVYIAKTHNRDSLVKISERKDASSFSQIKAKTLIEHDSGVDRIAWYADSKGFVFDRLKTFDHYNIYSDLWSYNLDSHKETQLTHGLRAHEPVISRDGKWIAFVQGTIDGTRVAAVDIDGSHFRVLYEPARQTRVSRPEFLTDEQIVFTEKVDDGKERFAVLTLPTQQTREVLQAYAPVHFPHMTDRGLLFISDRTGVANIYLWDTKGKVRAVSNSTTRLESPTLDSKTGELIYSRLNGEGAALTTCAESEWSKAAANPPKVGKMVDYEWPHYDPPHVAFDASKHDYRSWPYLIPRYWLPMLALDGSGVYIQASTATEDPLGMQGYALAASYDTYVHQPAFFGSYVNNQARYFSTALAVDEYYDAISSGGADRSNTDALLTLSSSLVADNFLQGGVGWMFSRTDYAGQPLMRNGPQVFVQLLGAKKRGLEISPEEGGNLRLSHTQFVPSFGDIGYAREDFASQLFLSNSFWPLKWLPDRHVLALSLNATIEPELHLTSLGPASLSGYYQIETINTRPIMRGYDTGTFIGRNFISGSAEYRFPIHYFYSGFGTAPLFVKRLHGALFSDVATLDGDYYNGHVGAYDRTQAGRQYFVGTGAELRADTTLFYQYPLTVAFGLYYGLNRDAGPGSVTPYLALGL